MWRFNLWAMACVFSAPGSVFAEPLVGTYELRGADIETFDPATFGPGPNVDEYVVLLTNPNEGDVTSVELTLRGDWQNFSGMLTFKADGQFPYLGPNFVADSFFVVKNQLALDVIDGGGVLQAAFTIAGGGVIVPGGSDGTLIAVVYVPTGTTIYPGLSFGRAAINGAFVDIVFPGPVPEPSTFVLGGCLAMTLFASRRTGPVSSQGVTG